VNGLKILFVCLGNICRSPLAEGFFKQLIQEAGLHDRIEVESAGTSAYHLDEPPHPGVRQLAERYGFTLDGTRSRQLTPHDLERFDLIIAMDRSNLEDILMMDPGAGEKAHLLLDFADMNEKDVHDPYDSGDFQRTYEQVEVGCRGLIEHLRRVVSA
jgi:protein-tyrosine phosphatase